MDDESFNSNAINNNTAELFQRLIFLYYDIELHLALFDEYQTDINRLKKSDPRKNSLFPRLLLLFLPFFFTTVIIVLMLKKGTVGLGTGIIWVCVGLAVGIVLDRLYIRYVLKNDVAKHNKEVDTLADKIAETYSKITSVAKELKENECINSEYGSPLGLYIAYQTSQEGRVNCIKAFKDFFVETVEYQKKMDAAEARAFETAMKTSKEETEKVWKEVDEVEEKYQSYCSELNAACHASKRVPITDRGKK